MVKIIRKAIQIISNEGPAMFVKKVASKIVSFHPYHVYELNLSREITKMDFALDLSFRFAIKSDIERMNKENYDFDDRDKAHCIERMAQGDRCLLAEHEGQVVGYMWVSADGIFELYPGKYMPLPLNKSYL